MSDLGTHGVRFSTHGRSLHNAPAVHEHRAVLHSSSAPGLREPQEYGGGATHANEPTGLRSHQVSSECLSGLNSGFPVVCQRLHVDSYSLSLNLTLYYKKKAKASPRTWHQQKKLLFSRPQCLQHTLSFNLLRRRHHTDGTDWHKIHPMS